MPRYLLVLPTILLAGFAGPVLASRVFVPTDVPTIQAAIDGGADSIAVLDGVAPERLTVTRLVVIEPVTGSRPYLGIWSSTPLVRSLQIVQRDPSSCCEAGIVARGIRFLGKVDASTLYNGGSLTFEACRFDSGFTGPGAGIATSFADLSVRGCLFLGDANLSGYVQFIGNTVIGGTLRVRADGVHDIRDNYVQGPAAAGMDLHLQESGGEVARNSIRGTADGIRLVGNGTMTAVKNDIADCSGNGIEKHSSQYGGVSCDSNTIARCGGAGIVVKVDAPFGGTDLSGFRGNVIRQVGLGGIDLGEGIAYIVRGNVILDAAGNGLTAGIADSCENNVIGRCGGAGIRLTSDPYHVVGNTIFSNSGPGLHFKDAYAGDVVAKNISVFNGGPGLMFEGTHFPQLSCNDWFGNSGGQTVGIPPSYADISVNPRFCDLGGGDVHLSASSPLLADPNCGLIGALAQGCVGTTDVPASPSSSALFHVSPTPARGAVTFTLPASTGPTKLEVFDVTGARRWESVIPAGATRLEWDGRGSARQRVPPGVYFARLRGDGASFPQVRMILTK